MRDTESEVHIAIKFLKQIFTFRMYDSSGVYLKETKLVNLTLRTGYLEDNLEYITQGAFRQPCAKFDYVVDPDVSFLIVFALQVANPVLKHFVPI